jgi:tol-pal system protein YbgF
VVFDRFMKRILALFLLSSAAVLPGCPVPQQIDVIEREQKTLRSQNLASRNEVDSIRSNLADTRANLDQANREIAALKEKVEEVRYQLDRQIGKSSKEGDQRVKDLEARLARVNEDVKTQSNQFKEQLKTRDDELRKMRDAMQALAADQKAAAAAAAAAIAAAEAQREKTERLATDSESIRREYDDAWRVVERKDYRAAIIKLKDFLKRYPNSDLGDNAQYWLGECHYALREFEQAILEFDTVRRKYPKGDKVPAALLKQGFAFAELGDKVDARLILQELVDRYPQTEEAGKAQQKLSTLGS